MTDQIPDSILLRGTEHLIVRGSGEGAFDPFAYDLCPGFGMNTGCRRGFVCTYALKADELVLAELDIDLDDEIPPPLGGVQPVEGRIGWLYSNPNIRVPYSGTMLVGSGFEPGKYAGNGAFDRPYCFNILTELSFEKGRLVREEDRSGMFESERQEHEAAERRAVEEVQAKIEKISGQKKPESTRDTKGGPDLWKFFFGPKQ